MAKVFDHSTHDKLSNVVLSHFGGHHQGLRNLADPSNMLDGATQTWWTSDAGKTNENRFDKKGVELTFTNIVKLQSFEIVPHPNL